MRLGVILSQRREKIKGCLLVAGGHIQSASMALIASLYCNYLLLTCLPFSCISGYSEHIYSMFWNTERLCAVNSVDSKFRNEFNLPCSPVCWLAWYWLLHISVTYSLLSSLFSSIPTTGLIITVLPKKIQVRLTTKVSDIPHSVR